MNTSDYSHTPRTLVACSIICLMVLGQLAPLASAARKSNARLVNRSLEIETSAPATLAPLVPTITATLTDSFPDLDGDLKANPGETITYTATIVNSGTDASGVQFTNTIDPNTTLVGGSVKVSPLAFADTYVAAQNTPLSVGAPGVLTNDTGTPAPTAVPIASGATANGGTVTLNADGSFLYTPAAAFTGADSFTYTATNGQAPNDTAIVTINVDAVPSVVSTTPLNGATDQALNTNITVTFSEPVNVTGDWFQISCTTSGTRNVADTVVTGGPTTFTINPNGDFTASETCTVTVFAAQVSDQDANDPPDNMAADHVFSFATIDAAPTVTNTNPANGAINQTTNANIIVTFSEPVNATGNWFQIVCGVSGTRNVADTVVTGGPSVFTINPNADFAPGETCTVTIFAAQVTDQDPNDPPDNMAANFVFSFSVDAAPTVNSTTPTNGATQVANNTNLSITFSEPVDVTGNWFQIVGASSGTRNVTDTVVTGGPTTFTINPNADFTNGESVTVTVFAAQVTDQDVNDPPENMAANFVFSFTIDQPPSVTTTVPTNGATDVLKGSNILVNFSENVNATTSSFTIECAAPGNLQGFAVTGSGTNAITLNPNSDLPPGVICTVTVIANQISDSDAGDPPDNMAANFVFSFGVKPEAVDDARNATGNIRIQTTASSGFSVLTNDIGPGITVTASDTTSLRGGNVTVAANGTFSYNPPAGYEGPDSFNYTISNAAGSDVGAVNITVAGMIWFIDDNPASGACTTNNNICGRLTNPFSTLAAFEAANGNATPTNGADVIAPEAGDHIFIFSGSYTGPLTLENSQRVIAQGATSSLQILSQITPAIDGDALPATGGTKPTITTVATSGQNGINLASGNQLFGLAFSNTDAAAIRGAINVGTLTMSDIVINNASGSGIILTNGGTVTISGINTIVTTTGTALNVTNTTIGASGLTFQTISSNGGSNTGIILDTTGGSGGLTVTGDGTNTSVGGNSTGGTIANKSGADGSTATGIGIYLNNTANVVLRRMTINGTNQNFGIRGFSVNNFTLEYSTVNGTNGTAASLAAPNGAGEGSIYFGNSSTNGMTGVGSVTNCIFGGGRSRNFSLINTAGTLNRLTITGSTFGSNQSFAGASGDSLSMEARNNGTVLNTTVTGSNFTGAPGDLVEFVAQQGSTIDLIFGGAAAGQSNTMSNNHPNNVIGGGGMTIASAGTLTFNVSNNSMRDANGSAVTMQLAAPLAGSSEFRSLNGTFNANTIGVAGVPNSGSATGNGIFLSFADNSTAPKSLATIAITNNVIRNYTGNAAIFADNTGGNYDVNATIIGNTAAEPGAGAFAGLALTAGAPTPTNDDIDVCASILGNNFSAGDPSNSNDIIVGGGSSGLSTIRLPGLVPSGTEAQRQAQVQSFILGNNNVAGTQVTAFVDAPATFASTFIGGAACTSPSAMALPVKSSWGETLAIKGSTHRSPIIASSNANEVTEPKRLVRQTFSHHAKAAKRKSTTPVSSRQGAMGSNTMVTTWAESNNRLSRLHLNSTQDKKQRQMKIPRLTPNSGETVSLSIGTLLAGKSVTITYQVTVDTPYLGGPNVSNQGTVSGSDFADVLTDDPAVGGAADPTLTPILLSPNISVADAQANEPATGSNPMLFTVSLLAPAPAGGAMVHYSTADEAPAINHAVAGVDYTAVPDTVLSFAPGEQFKTISVDILADNVGGEVDETFLLNLSNPTNAVIVDGQAVGTIKQGNAAGTLLISELRTSGPAGAGDDFVEIYNNSDTPLTIAASDASAGYGLFKMGADCSATPVLIGTIPNGTVIPARGHYLFVGSAYSLANYGGTGAAAGNQTLAVDIESDFNVGIFNTSSIANLSSLTRLDAVGFGGNTGGNCDLLREGPTLPALSGSVLEYSFHRDQCGKGGNPAMFGPCPTSGLVKDTNDNAVDFIFAETSGALTIAGQRLGAPGPENLGSPILRNSTIGVLLLDSSIGASAQPNRVRDLTPSPPNAVNGTLSVRRRFVNNTGSPVTRLRFRIVDISSFAVPGGIADVRALTSTSVVVSGIADASTCLASNGVATTPCSVTVQGTTLEQPPTQSSGGAWNSTLGAGTITLATPLAPGASINIQFLLGVQQTGSFKFFVNIEALP